MQVGFLQSLLLFSGCDQAPFEGPATVMPRGLSGGLATLYGHIAIKVRHIEQNSYYSNYLTLPLSSRRETQPEARSHQPRSGRWKQ